MKKTFDIISYITLIGFIITLVCAGKDCKFHVNQSFVIFLTGIICTALGAIPVVGTIISVIGGILCLVCWIMGLVSAIKGVEKPVPVLGKIKLFR